MILSLNIKNGFSYFVTDMSDYLFFPVEDLTFNDLLDWADPNIRGRFKPQQGRVHRPQRRNSQTGSLVEVNECKIALFRYGDKVYAINEKCPHAGGPLHVGDIETLPDASLCVRCPWHSWCFDLTTGEAKRPQHPDIMATVYPIQVAPDGTLRVGFKEFDQSYFKEFDS